MREAVLRQRFRRVEHLLRRRANAKILGEIHPSHGAAPVDEELGRPRDVVTFLARALVQQVVLADRLGVRIGEERERVAGLAAKIGRLLRRVDADGDGTNARGLECWKVLLDTP